MAFTARTETYARGSSLTTPFDFTINKAGGVVDGDIMFMFLATYIATPPTVDSVPNGWELVATNATSYSRWYLYFKIASGEGTSYTWSLTKSCRYYALNIAYSSGDFNVSSLSDITAISNTLYGTANSTVRAASMNVPATNSPLVYFAAIYNTTVRTFTAPTNPSGWVEDADQGHSTPDISITNGSLIWTESGATGNMDVVCSTSITTEKHAFAIALNPPAPTYEASYTGQTERFVNKADSFAGQCERIIKSAANYSAQTVRDIITVLEASFTGSTKRVINSLSSFSGQTKRAINSAISFSGQCNRVIKASASYLAQTLRNIEVIIEASFEASTKRIIQKISSFTGTTKRLITRSAIFDGTTRRMISLTGAFVASCKRAVRSYAGFNGSTKRLINSATSFAAQTLREITTGMAASFNAASLRAIKSVSGFSASSKRNIVSIASFIASAKRLILSIGLFNSSSKRTLASTASFNAQTRRTLTDETLVIKLLQDTVRIDPKIAATGVVIIKIQDTTQIKTKYETIIK